MNASTIQLLRRAEVLAAPLSAFSSWHIMATCPTCRVRRYLPVNALVRRHGGAHLVEAVVSRLRCDTAQCGRAPSFVRLQSRPDYAPGPPIREVILVGAGAL